MMMSAMHREPFYANGTRISEAAGVWAGWTAHADSTAHAICTTSQEDGVALLVAGEPVAPGSGVGDSPAEIVARILAGYRRNGTEYLGRLRGVFSLALIDPVARSVHVANDQFGLERLYWGKRADVIYVSSEAKALLAVLPESRRFDDEAVAQYARFGSVTNNRTLFRGLALVPGGTVACVREGSGWRPAPTKAADDWERQEPLPQEAFDRQFEEALRTAVARCFRAGPAAGVSITGGLDTRMIMACLPELRPGPPCYTFAGLAGEPEDARVGRTVATACRLPHHTLRVTTDFLERFGEYVDRTVRITDGCAGATGAHEIHLTAQARELAPVRVTGNFGSEILRGVSTLRPMISTDEHFSLAFRPLVQAATPGALPAHPVTRAAFAEVPWHLCGTMIAGRSQVVFRTPYLDEDVVRLAYRVPAADRVGSGPALRLIVGALPELARIPTDRGLRAGDGRVSSIIRRGMAEVLFKLDYLDKEGAGDRQLPFGPLLRVLRKTPLLGRHKYLEYRAWFQHELAPYVSQVIHDPRVAALGYWDMRALLTLHGAHRDGRRAAVAELGTVLTLEAVDRLLLSAINYPTTAVDGPIEVAS
jgi:asparagine synthase (glutamine-hydrolysing)